MQAHVPDCEEVHREEVHVVQRKLGACVSLRAFSCRIAQASSCAWCVKFLHVGTQLESLSALSAAPLPATPGHQSCVRAGT